MPRGSIRGRSMPGGASTAMRLVALPTATTVVNNALSFASAVGMHDGLGGVVVYYSLADAGKPVSLEPAKFLLANALEADLVCDRCRPCEALVIREWEGKIAIVDTGARMQPCEKFRALELLTPMNPQSVSDYVLMITVRWKRARCSGDLHSSLQK